MVLWSLEGGAGSAGLTLQLVDFGVGFDVISSWCFTKLDSLFQPFSA